METLREARKRSGLSQSALGGLVGVDAVSIHNVEYGKTVPRPDLRRAIEQALDAHIDWIATRIGRPVDAEEGDSEEELVLRQMWAFAYSTRYATARRSRLKWMRTVIDFLETS